MPWGIQLALSRPCTHSRTHQSTLFADSASFADLDAAVRATFPQLPRALLAAAVRSLIERSLIYEADADTYRALV